MPEGLAQQSQPHPELLALHARESSRACKSCLRGASPDALCCCTAGWTLLLLLLLLACAGLCWAR